MKGLRFVFKKGHPNWRNVCKALGADFIQIKDPTNNLKLRKYFYRFQLPITIVSSLVSCFFTKKEDGTTYILSGIQPIFFPIFMRKIKKEKNKIIVIANDASFYLENKSASTRNFYKIDQKLLQESHIP